MGGMWSSYVEQDLLPRLHGFELLMASYAMAHLKLDMLLADTGYEPIKPKRLQVYLTNSLEEHNPDTGTLFAGWLSAEANEANAIKRDAPVMVVMGNPPYAVSSTNKGEWIQGLIADYKKDLNERKINLDDDYIKFIRYGQHYIEKNGEGILDFITNNSFIDGITRRQMRKSLMETFDKIHIIDLHGNSNRKETTPNGGKDENVFDIRQGVSINIFIKTMKKDACKVYATEIYGLREEKYDYLEEKSISSIDWTLLKIDDEYCFFSDRSLNNDKYMNDISLSDLFKTFGTGIETKCDDITVGYTFEEMSNVVRDFKELSSDALLAKYKRKNSKGWCYEDAKKDVLSFEGSTIVRSVSYRPFDKRYTVYTGNSSGIMGRPRFEVMKNLFDNNLSLTSTRSRRNDASCYLISDTIVDKSVTSSLDNNYIFPLYLYSDPKEENQTELLESDIQDTPTRIPNLDSKIVADIAKAIKLTFTNEKTDAAGTFAPIDILDYIYAVLHSPTYRETYKEFLKIDFPRVPYPSDVDTFWQLVALGGDLRQIHLLESPKLAAQRKSLSLGYPISGDSSVTRKMTKTSIGFEPDEVDSSIGKVWLNDTQYFTNVPLVAWEFYIGGYQPAQKWLKDRRDRMLDHHDIKHYLNIIASLSLTNELMQQIDEINVIN